MPARFLLLRNPLIMFVAFLLIVSGSRAHVSVALVGTPTVVGQGIAAACRSIISFGETMECSIENEGESDTYTLTADLNDEVKVRMTRMEGRVNPAIHILNQAGKHICSAFASESIVEIGRCTIPAAGTYTLIAEDTYRANTGTYHLYVQRLNNPGNARLISAGQILPGAIDLAAEIDTYTFRAVANSRIKVGMTRIANTLRPRIRVYDPDGINICSAFSSGDVTELSSCSLSRAGAYTILADETGSRTGDYTMSLECVESECMLATTRVYLPFVARQSAESDARDRD